MAGLPSVPVFLACLVGFIFIRWCVNPLRSIPTLGGPSLPGLSILSALYFISHSQILLDKGYKKYENSAFKVPLLDKWVVVVCGPKMCEELRKFRDDELSSFDGIREFTQTGHTSGPEVLADPANESSTIIKENLTRGVPEFTPIVANEVQRSLQERISAQDGEWVPVNGWDLTQDAIARSTSRVFIGLPLCRDKRWLSHMRKHLADFMRTTIFMNIVPRFMKPFVGPRISKVAENVAAFRSILGLVIKGRRDLMAENGNDWDGKPWILDRSARKGKSSDYVIERLLGVSFGAINTTTDALTHVLYHLAALPETHETLRNEIEPLIASEGWTVAAINQMVKLDGFMKESQRYTGIGMISQMKKALKDMRLSDGTFIPKGTCLVSASGALHHDEKHYPDPEVFDPFRFSGMREQHGDSVKYQFTTASATYLPWGYGPHACPGRFFAVMQMKVILANIIVHYDLKLGGDGRRPKEVRIGFAVNPARDGVVLLRERRAEWMSQAS